MFSKTKHNKIKFRSFGLLLFLLHKLRTSTGRILAGPHVVPTPENPKLQEKWFDFWSFTYTNASGHSKSAKWAGKKTLVLYLSPHTIEARA